MRNIPGLWRWRRSPLRRRTDLAEAWIAFVAAALLLLGVPSAGMAGGMAAYGELSRIVRAERLTRHQVWATAARPVELPQTAGDGTAPLDDGPERHPVPASWEGPDGLLHTGTVQALRPVAPGERFRVWTDADGALTSPPLTRGAAVTHSVAAALVAGALAGIAVETGRRRAMGQLLRRRYSDWEEEWARIGPDWGRAGSNS